MVPSDGSSTYNIAVFDYDTKHASRPMSTALDMYIYKEIPSGFKVTSVTMTMYHKFATDSTDITVYEGFLDDTDSVSRGSLTATGTAGVSTETINIVTSNFNSTNNNMVVIKIDADTGTFRFYGGYLTIAEI